MVKKKIMIFVQKKMKLEILSIINKNLSNILLFFLIYIFNLNWISALIFDICFKVFLIFLKNFQCI